MSLDYVSQWIIFSFGIPSAILNAFGKPKFRRIGFIISLSAQPAWFYSTLSNYQYGTFCMCCFYTGCFIFGIIRVNKEIRRQNELR